MFNPDEIISRLRTELKAAADEITKASSQRYFKETIQVYGVKSAVVDRIAKTHIKTIMHLSKTEVLQLAESFMQSKIMEESFVACNWAYAVHKQFQPEDFVILERWVNSYVTNWATCDTLCNHTIAAFIEQYPEYIRNLKQWTRSNNRWVKRAAAVTLIIPARHGQFLPDIFEIADALLLDPDDLVQKGYGWLLKAASQAHLQKVFEYVLSKKAIMPRTALRYAIEKMPMELKKQAMTK